MDWTCQSWQFKNTLDYLPDGFFGRTGCVRFLLGTTFSGDGGQKLCCKKPGANWRLGGNFVGCSNRPVNMVKATRRGKRVGGNDVSKS